MDKKKEFRQTYGNAVERSKNVPRKVKNQAKTMYLSGMDPEKICDILKLDEDVLRYWILGTNRRGDSQGCWMQVKDSTTDTVVDLFVKNKYDQLERVAGLALALVQHGLTEIKNEVESGLKTLSIAEVKSVAEIIGQLDKVARLESGQATEIIDKSGLSAKQAREILRNDPFAMGIVEVKNETKE